MKLVFVVTQVFSKDVFGSNLELETALLCVEGEGRYYCLSVSKASKEGLMEMPNFSTGP